MLRTKLLFLLGGFIFLLQAKAQNKAQDTSSIVQSDSAAHLRLVTKVQAITDDFSGILNDDGMDEYTYTVTVKNKNDVAVEVTLGSLVYGHYAGCIEKQENFVLEGKFEEKTITIPAKSRTRAKMVLQRKSTPPTYCTGVPAFQRVKVVRVNEATLKLQVNNVQ